MEVLFGDPKVLDSEALSASRRYRRFEHQRDQIVVHLTKLMTEASDMV